MLKQIVIKNNNNNHVKKENKKIALVNIKRISKLPGKLKMMPGFKK